jgi:hypothetical protein
VGKIVVEVPEEFKALAASMKAMVDLVGLQLAAQRRGTVGYAQYERLVEERSGAIERAMHEIALAGLDIDAKHVAIEGVPHESCLRGPASYMTRAGPVVVVRSLFRKSGDRGGPTVDLVALRSGAIEGNWLPGAAESMAFLLQQSPSREAQATARNMGRLPYASSSFEEVGHAVAKRYTFAAKRIDDQLVRTMDLPEGLASISVALDRVSVPIAEPRPRPVGRPRKGAAKNPIKVVYHMAYCGTVTLHDKDGKALHTIRYGCMPDGDPEGLVDGMAGDVLVLRQRRANLLVVLLSDGAPEMHNRLDQSLYGEEYGVVLRLIDFWHLLEKLAEAAKLLLPEEKRNALLGRWRLALLNRRDARATVLEELRASGKDNIKVGDGRPVHEAITYLENNADRMDFVTARKKQLPIGSGAVEATCKSLVGVRMHRSGARWKQPNADLVVHIRALALSDRWDEAMSLTLHTPPVAARILRAA